LAAAAGVAFPPRPLWAEADARPVVNDVTLLDPVRVSQIAIPHTTDEVRRLVDGWPGAISVGGGRYSMGGQVAVEDSLHLDMRGFNQLVRLDPERKTVRVQTGMRWRDLQTIIDPHNLAVKIMQSYANFTIGGALSVNAHGRYVGAGPIINSVRGIQVVLPRGVVVEASPTQETELFYGAIGGYGGLGVITEVELDLVPNVKMERRIDRIPIGDYRAYFAKKILGHPDAILHNADFALPDLAEALAVTWFETDKSVTVADRLSPVGSSDPLQAGAIWALAELPGARLLRRELVEPIEQAGHPVVWRNHEASIDVASLGKIATVTHTYALEEYFIPVGAFETFTRQMSRILRANHVNAVNVSVRHAPADPGAILGWAREEVFSFVLYYRQHSSLEAREQVGNWTRQLIDAALAVGGAYYLPYQLHASLSQFERAYPGAARFFALKALVDPDNQFRNKLWEKYARAAP
jgi:FAD/FMN-containing dehydrogenase